MNLPSQTQLIQASTNVGAIGLGLIVGKIVQEVAMKNEATGKGFIPDNLLTNGAAAAVLAVGSILVPNKFLSLSLAAAAGYFLIRTVNKGTEKLSGLGTLSGGFKDFLNKYVPQLKGIEDEYENYSGYGDAYGNPVEEAYLLPEAEMNMSGMGNAVSQAMSVPSGSNLSNLLA